MWPHSNDYVSILILYIVLGDEIGMMEDMCVAITELATVQFQVHMIISMYICMYLQ